MSCPLHLWEVKDGTTEADGSGLCSSKNVFEKGGENYVYHFSPTGY